MSSSEEIHIAQLNLVVTAGSATVKTGVDPAAITADAYANVNVSATLLQKLFIYHTNSTDITTSTDTSDLLFKVDYTSAAEIGTAIDLNTTTIMDSNDIDPNANDKHLAFDYVRYLADNLFNTHLAVDLFDNETELRTGLNTDFQTGLIERLQSYQTNGPLTISNGHELSPSYTIYNQLIKNHPSRFNDIVSYQSNHVDSAGNVYYKLPIAAGDKIYYKLTVKAADGQHLLTGVPQILDRSYRICIIAV